MLENQPHEIFEVPINKLQNRMVIVAYTGFDERYQSMNEETCAWVRLNFKEVKAIVEREEKEIEVLSDQIRSGDKLIKLYDFPAVFKKITYVSEKLINEIKTRGFLNFDVYYLPKILTKEQKKRLGSTQKAQNLINTVKEQAQVREDATNAIENLLDQGRSGEANTAEIDNYAENIIANSSAEALTAIVSLKESDQTYSHCVDVGVIFQTAYNAIKKIKKENSIFKDQQQSLLSGFLHDFGKSKIPKEILDSTVRFEKNSLEMRIIKTHPDYSAQLLSDLGQPDSIINMAQYHHVKCDTAMSSSYPKGVTFDQLLYETKLISIVDIYQALVGKRKYKKSWPPPAVIRYLDALASVEYDEQAWEDFLQVMGFYPVGSLVKLDDTSLAFVIGASSNDLERPQIALIKNSKGEQLQQNTFIDLEEEKDISIVDDLDAQEIFGESCLDIFMNLNVT